MFEVEPIIVDHKDVIHDVVFDYYGRRMATCSSDQTVKVSVFEKNLIRIMIITKCFSCFVSRYGMKMNRVNGQ